MKGSKHSRWIAAVLSASVLLTMSCGAAFAASYALMDESPWQTAEEVMKALPDLPLSRHAQETHLNQAYNAPILVKLFTRKECRPIYVYFCPEQKKVELMCELKPGFTGGVIVGYESSPAIVTGYAQRTNGWKHTGCLPPVAIP